jgi:hypothetical protein
LKNEFIFEIHSAWGKMWDFLLKRFKLFKKIFSGIFNVAT